MAHVLLISPRLTPRPVPALALLPHTTTTLTPSDEVLTASAKVDVILVDGRDDLVAARGVCSLFSSVGVTIPRLLLIGEGGLAALSADWDIADFILDDASPAELDARIRVLTTTATTSRTIAGGGIVIDEAAYSVKLNDTTLDLTYTEFELLKYLVEHPGRVFSREHLLSEVWGYDYFGGTRTVDVHVRRLRAKLGVEHEALIATVRNVGYRFSARS